MWYTVIVFLLALGVLITVVVMMSVGVMAGRKPISGSCGGLQNAGVDAAWEVCGGDPKKCEATRDDAIPDANSSGAQYYDASRS